MNLVEEKHLPLSHIGQDRCQVALDLKCGPGGLLKSYVQLVSYDRRQCRLSQPRGSEEQHVVEGLTPRPSSLQSDRQLLLCLLLTNKFVQVARAQLQLKRTFILGASRAHQPFRIIFA